MKTVLIILSTLISLNSWSASPKRSPTPNYLPAGVCNFQTKSLVVPNTDIRISRFEVFTSRRGTGCLRGQKESFWNKCDIRKDETAEGSDPTVELILKFKNSQNYKDGGQLIFQMSELAELGWMTDRKGNPKSIIETTKRRDVEIKGLNFNIIAKRQIKNLSENKIVTELFLYLPDQNNKSRLVLQASCESDITVY